MSERRVVVVEDDADVRHLLESVLVQAGFEVHSADDGRTGVELVRTVDPDVVTLDLGLPDVDGLEVARRIRDFSDTYILMLTARADELDAVEGFSSGADDFLTKPFRPRELRARLDGMLRRPRTSAMQGRDVGRDETLPDEGDRLRHKGLEVNTATRTVYVQDRPVELTRMEFDLLRILLENGKRVHTRADLVRRLHDTQYDTGVPTTGADERGIEVHIANLRRRLGDDARNPKWIRTIHGVGYRLAP